MYIFAFMRLRPWQRVAFIAGVVFGSLALATSLNAHPRRRSRWSPEERAVLRSLSLSAQAPLPADPSNRFANDSGAARLGQLLFFDSRLSRTGTISCASCHIAEREFQDGLRVGRGVGAGSRRTMPIAGTARGAWYFWDGRADSQWEQALGPLENPAEHGGDRAQYAHTVRTAYRAEYEATFGALPSLAGLPAHASPSTDSASAAAWARIPTARRDDISRVYANIGKAIAAYERRIDFAPSRFDRFVAAELGREPRSPASGLTPDEESGLRLFIGKASCVNCHNGSSLTDNHFHNTGVTSDSEPSLDSGRSAGVATALAAEFSCTSRYSDAQPGDCAELRFAVAQGPELVRAYKTPSLRNVASRAPYMHAGQLASLDRVLRHYSDAPAAPSGHSELKPLHLTNREQRQIIAFLGTLSGPLAAPDGFLAAPPRS